MKLKLSAFITAIICFVASFDLISMAEHVVEGGFEHGAERPAERRPEEELQSQLRERELLDERLKESEREQETLLREMKAEGGTERKSEITDRLSELNKSQEQIQGQLKQVGTVIESLERQVEAPTVSVTPVEQAGSVETWKSNWNAISEPPGRLWGAGGELYTATSAGERIAKIIESIESIPTESYENLDNAKTSLATLESISKTMNDLVSKKLLEKDSNYKNLVTALGAKAADIIAKSDFRQAVEANPLGGGESPTRGDESENINGLADLYNRIGKLTIGEKPVADFILNRMRTEIASADRPELKAIESILEDKLGHQQDVMKKLEALVARRLVGTFKEEVASKETPKVDIATISKAHLEAVPQNYRNLVEVAIVDQFKQDIGRITAAQDKPVETRLTTAIEEFNKLQKVGLDPALQAKLVDSMKLGLQRLVTDKSMPSDIVQRVSTLERLADTLAGNVKNPELVKVITGQARSLVTSEVQNHTLIADALKAQAKAEPGKPQQAYDAYAQELKLLDNFNALEVKYGDDDPALTEAKLDIAKRKTMLLDFIEARKTLLQGKGLWQKFTDLLKPSDPLVDYVKAEDPDFYDQQQKIKKLYSISELYALPEDLIDIAKNDLKRLESVTDAKEKSSLTEELKRIKDLISDPKTVAAFKGISGYETVVQSVNERIEGRSQEEVAKKEALKTQAGDLINEINKMTVFENPEALSSRIDEVTNEIQKFAELTSLSEAGKLDALNMMRNLQAWSDVLALASSYHAMNKSGATAEAAHATVVALQEKVPSILNELNYKTREVFTDRVQIMEQQLNALTKMSRVLSEPVGVGEKKYTLAELKTYLNDFQTRDEKPAAEIWEALKSSGFVSSGPQESEVITIAGTTEKTTHVVDAVTDKGLALIEVGKQHELIQRRVIQLDNFVKSFPPGKEPGLAVYNSSGKEIALATELKLSWLIPEDEMNLLKAVYNKYYVGGEFNDAITSLLESASVDTEAQATAQKAQTAKLNKINKASLLIDIGDCLQNIRTLTEKAPREFQVSNPYFEAVVTEEQKLQDPNLTRAEKQQIRSGVGHEGMLEKIRALSDPQAFFEVTGPGLIQDTKIVFQEIGTLFSNAFTDVSLTLRGWKKLMQEKSAKALWASVLPGSILAFFGTEVAVRAGVPLLTGPLAAVTSLAVNSTYIPEILAATTAIATGAGVAYAAYKAEPSPEAIKAFNEEVVKAGYTPEEIKENKWFFQKASEKVLNLFRSSLTVELNNAAKYNENILQQKEKTFEMARAQLLEQLGLKPEASLTDVQYALKEKGAVLDKSFAINRWLIGRRIKNAYDFMIKSGLDMSEAHLEYNGRLTGALITQMGELANGNASILGKAKSGWTNFTSYFSKIEAQKKLSPQEFATVTQQLIQVYQGNVADLIALKEMIDKNSSSLNRTTLFSDTTFTDTAKLFIDRQQQLVSQSFQQNVNAVLQGYGQPSVEVQRAQLAKKT